MLISKVMPNSMHMYLLVIFKYISSSYTQDNQGVINLGETQSCFEVNGPFIVYKFSIPRAYDNFK